MVIINPAIAATQVRQTLANPAVEVLSAPKVATDGTNVGAAPITPPYLILAGADSVPTIEFSKYRTSLNTLRTLHARITNEFRILAWGLPKNEKEVMDRFSTHNLPLDAKAEPNHPFYNEAKAWVIENGKCTEDTKDNSYDIYRRPLPDFYIKHVEDAVAEISVYLAFLSIDIAMSQAKKDDEKDILLEQVKGLAHTILASHINASSPIAGHDVPEDEITQYANKLLNSPNALALRKQTIDYFEPKGPLDVTFDSLLECKTSSCVAIETTKINNLLQTLASQFPTKTIPRTIGIYDRFVNAIKSGLSPVTSTGKLNIK